MNFEWDETKAKANLKKHGIDFETAVLIFDDQNQVSIPDHNAENEERWQTLGKLGNVLVLLVVHTYREKDGKETNRIISARNATKHERRKYEQVIKKNAK
jgi:uncharacterized DUF497 family protein